MGTGEAKGKAAEMEGKASEMAGQAKGKSILSPSLPLPPFPRLCMFVAGTFG